MQEKDETWFSHHSSTLTIPAHHHHAHQALTAATALPSWNPAFTAVSPTSDPAIYKVTVHRLLTGTLRYLSTFPTISMLIEVPGLTELSSWEFHSSPQSPGQVTITHQVQQRGPLARFIGQQEAALVPGKRLLRLAALLNSPRHA